MSRTSPTPPPAAGDPNRRPGGPTGPGMPAQKPGVTPPMAPPVGQSAPPNRSGQPADRAHAGAVEWKRTLALVTPRLRARPVELVPGSDGGKRLVHEDEGNVNSKGTSRPPSPAPRNFVPGAVRAASVVFRET